MSVSDLHTGECIHRCYFIAGPSIQTVGDVRPFAKVSMICSNTVTFQFKMRGFASYVPFFKITCHHLECLVLPFPVKGRSIFVIQQREVSPPRNVFDNKVVQIPQVKINQHADSVC